MGQAAPTLDNISSTFQMRKVGSRQITDQRALYWLVVKAGFKTSYASA